MDAICPICKSLIPICVKDGKRFLEYHFDCAGSKEPLPKDTKTYLNPREEMDANQDLRRQVADLHFMVNQIHKLMFSKR